MTRKATTGLDSSSCNRQAYIAKCTERPYIRANSIAPNVAKDSSCYLVKDYSVEAVEV
ncbi:MAG: hypothetical protein ACRD8Z_20565 [Nitrososphaeraceae archaeon]